MTKFAISNLSFKEYPIDDALMSLRASQIEGLEIAPTLIWREPEHATKKEREEFKALVSSHELPIVSLQSLLYGKPELQLFGDSKTQEILLEYLKEMVNLCAELGGRLLSFGSPKNRGRGELGVDEAISRVTPLFYALAEYAKSFKIIICIEPISSSYGCDFITNTGEGVRLIESVGHSNFKLLLDTGTLILNKEDCDETIRKNLHHITHIHINDPQLFPPSIGVEEHSIIANTLRSVGYSGWLTLEFMRYYTSLEQDIVYGLECYERS